MRADPDARLQELESEKLGGYGFELDNVKKGRFAEERNFDLYLTDQEERRSSAPVIVGKYFAGRGRTAPVWMEIIYLPRIRFDDTEGSYLDLQQEGLEKRIFEVLASVIPASGRLFVQYEGLEGDDTAEALSHNVPAPATRLGEDMWRAGFRWFKDWYYPEGWMEGGAKLQGNKPANEEAKRQEEIKAAEELRAYLEREPEASEETEARARERAHALLESLDGGVSST